MYGGLGGMGLVGLEIAFGLHAQNLNDSLLPATMGDVSAMYDREFHELISRGEALAASVGAKFEGASWYQTHQSYSICQAGMAVLTFSMETEGPVEKWDTTCSPPISYWVNEKQCMTFQITGHPGDEYILPMQWGGTIKDVSALAGNGDSLGIFRQELSNLTVLANRVMACGALLDLAAEDSKFASQYEADPREAVRALDTIAQLGLTDYSGANRLEGSFIYHNNGSWNHSFGVERPQPFKPTNTPSYLHDLLTPTERTWPLPPSVANSVPPRPDDGYLRYLLSSGQPGARGDAPVAAYAENSDSAAAAIQKAIEQARDESLMSLLRRQA
jgi:hypothetical protein